MTDSTLGLPFFSGSKAEVRKKIEELSLHKKGASVIFANAHVVVEANQNSALREILQSATLVVPDGVPITWVMHALGKNSAQRYSGPDLMEDLFLETENKKHFFLGSSPQVLEAIRKRFKGNACGFYSPPFAPQFSAEEKEKQLRMVAEAKADYIWVGLGAPKQEKYVVEMAEKSKGGVWLAVGAAFDFYGGKKPRAPKALQTLGLEWAFRMFTEPRRLAIRYVKTNPVFIGLALKEIYFRRTRNENGA
jgi:N-acetylglucosaminyldiphosphoundecaprenol N-acetyl-beta-D-mannosaminyltransferase